MIIYRLGWLFCLFLLNVLSPLFFINHYEAQLVLLAGILYSVLLVILYKKYGFSKKLCLAELPLIPLIFFLWNQMSNIPLTTSFDVWRLTVALLNTIALIFDLLLIL